MLFGVVVILKFRKEGLLFLFSYFVPHFGLSFAILHVGNVGKCVRDRS